MAHNQSKKQLKETVDLHLRAALMATNNPALQIEHQKTAETAHHTLQKVLNAPCDTGDTCLKIFQPDQWRQLSYQQTVALLSNHFYSPIEAGNPYSFILKLKIEHGAAAAAVLTVPGQLNDLLTWPIVRQVSAEFVGGKFRPYGRAFGVVNFRPDVDRPSESDGDERRRCCELQLPEDWLDAATVGEAAYLHVHTKAMQ